MANYFQASQLMFGARVRYGIAYKVDQPNFVIYTRKYFHNFKVQLDTNNYEGALGSNLEKHKMYAMSIGQSILIKDIRRFKTKQLINLEDQLESNESILYQVVSRDESKIAVCIGFPLIGEKYQVSKIAVLECDDDKGFLGIEYELVKILPISLEDTCTEFHFNYRNSEELYFFTRNSLVKINYTKEQVQFETIYKF